MSWALHHTDPFVLDEGDVADQVRRALVVSNGVPPTPSIDKAIDAAAELLPLVAERGDNCYVTVTGHEGDVNSLTVSVSAGNQTKA